MWTLSKETPNVRTYRNSVTNTDCTTEVIYTDKFGIKWWSFSDLFQLPVLREVAARKVTDLYTASITKADIDEYLNGQKTLLKSSDPEKYEKMFMALTNFENAVSTVADPVKNLLALCTVYVLQDDERPDGYSLQKAMEKIDIWKEDEDATIFFLSWLTGTINSFLSASKKTSPIVTKPDGVSAKKRSMRSLKK